MSRALIVTPEAETDILDGFRSYEEKQAGLGARFLDEIGQSLDRIAPNLYLYQEVEPDIRRAVVHTFPYLMFYTFRNSTFLISCRLAARQTAISGRGTLSQSARCLDDGIVVRLGVMCGSYRAI